MPVNSEDVAELVRAHLAGGEGPTVEYKSSFRHDHKTSVVNKDLTKAVVKTLAAFLNSQGGNLLIGIDDDGQVVGLEADIATLGKKNDLDGYQLALRSAISAYLGPEIDPHIRIDFADFGSKHVAVVTCSPHPIPVYFRDGDLRELWVRSGNLSRSLDPAAAVAYAGSHWRSHERFDEERLRSVVEGLLSEKLDALGTPKYERREQVPLWLHLATRRVLDMFLGTLSRAHGWKKLTIISPWISEVDGPLVTLNFDQLLRRLRDERTTAYVVTRPPENEWHARAIERLADSGRASIKLLPELHVKLYAAQTVKNSFAMLGSANFTKQSLIGREIGVLIASTGDGTALVRELEKEAADIYRHPQGQLICSAKL